MNTGSNRDFKEGLKNTSLFGGVQIFKILLKIISTKFVALLLGPTGVGISGLFGATTSIIAAATNMGLQTSTVRDLSQSYSSNNKHYFYRTVTICRKLVWLTGSAGLLVCLLFSPLWSKLSFGDYSYTLSFAALSITLLLSQISMGQNVVLQGTRSFKYMAKAGVIGSVLGLFTSLPLYYFYGIDGIVPAMIISSVSGILLTYHFSRKIPIEKVRISFKTALKEGSTMLNMGFFVALQGFLSLLCAYIVRIYISNKGTIEDVGLYNSGFTIINTYVGMVFSAMAIDYYPKLSSYAHSSADFNRAINQQIELSLFLLSPMIALFLVFSDWVIYLLYSSKFLSCSMMVSWGILGILLKAPSWCLGYTFLAKGDTKAFFINEVIAETNTLILNISFYYIWGLNGLGASFVVSFFIYLIQVFWVSKYRYGYVLDNNIIKISFPGFIISIAIFIIIIYGNTILRYAIGVPLALLSCYFAYRNLNSRIDVKGVFISRIKSKINKR